MTYDLPLGELQRYAPSVRAVTRDQLRQAVQAELDVDQPSIIVVGEAAAFLEKLKSDYPGLELIEAPALNLETPSLR